MQTNPVSRSRARFAAAVAALWLSLVPLAQGQTVADYARPPQIGGFAVAPSNERATFLVRTDNGHAAAAVIDLAAPGKPRVIAGFSNADVTRIRWVNDKRVVYEVFRPGPEVADGGAGTFAVDIDGADERQLIAWTHTTDSAGSAIRSRVLPLGWFVWRALGDGSDDVLIYRNTVGERFFGRVRSVSRLNTRTRELSSLSYGQPDGAEHWVFDNQGQLRVVQARRGDRTALHWRAPGADSRWVELESHPLFDPAVLTPRFIEADGTLIVSTRRGRDSQALFSYDPVRRKLGDEPLVAVAGFDVEDRLDVDRRAQKLAGVSLQLDRATAVWFDDRLAAVQSQVDAALPGRTNRLLCGSCLTARHFVIASRSDRLPGEYFVFDADKRSLRPLGVARPWLKPETQGRRSFHRVPARDGLSLPVVLTHPAGQAPDHPLPAVMLVHGGPWVRGTDTGWEQWAQFLAARGYRVIEVDFRGSTGLGEAHFRAGWKQWGQKMQDDLVDALDWAIAQGGVDRKRVCLFGASYGGYAALMGPVRHPERYRCAASFAGVTDIALMFDDNDSDITEASRRYGLPELIGDPEADAEMMRRHSPVHRVQDIKVPVLLVQGGKDVRVTKKNADRFEAAARAAGVDLERVDYWNEGHGFMDPKNEEDFLQRLAAFLARYLKPVP